jgi:hypothetical protein
MITLLFALGFFAAQDLSDDSLEKLKSYITPKAQEMAWREIPWRPVFWDAVIEGQQKDKPVLLWGMNGHPLACT